MDLLIKYTQWLNYSFLGIAAWQYLLSFFIVLFTFLSKKALEILFVPKLTALLEKKRIHTSKKVIDALKNPFLAFFLISGLQIGLSVLILGSPFSDKMMQIAGTSYFVATTLIGVWATVNLVDLLSKYLGKLLAKSNSPIDEQFTPIIRKSLNLFVIVIGLLIILSALDIDIAGFLAGLGIGGLAIALAAKDTLGNFFGSIAIFADRPFKIGDWIRLSSGDEGFVEEIGFRSTKLRTFPKTLLSIPNQKLSNEIIDNWSCMPKRRVVQTISLPQETPVEKLEDVLENMRSILKNDPDIDQDFLAVHFKEFSPYSLDIMVYYFTKSTSALDHWKTKERINFNLLKCIKEAGLTLAKPARSLFFEKTELSLPLQKSLSAKPLTSKKL